MKYHKFKRSLVDLFVLIASLLLSTTAFATNGHEIKLKIEGLHDTIIYFGNHFGDKQYVSDTIKVDHNGNCVVKGKDTLEGGIYLIVMPNKNYFEIVVNDQKFSIETDTGDFYGKMKISGSPDNVMFRDYNLYMANVYKKSKELQAQMDKHKGDEDALLPMLSRRSVELNRQTGQNT